METLQQFSQIANPEQLIDAIGGERLDGSGFEKEDPDGGFAENED